MEIDELISGVIIKEIDEALGKRSNVVPRIPFLEILLLKREDLTDFSFAFLDFVNNIFTKFLSS